MPRNNEYALKWEVVYDYRKVVINIFCLFGGRFLLTLFRVICFCLKFYYFCPHLCLLNSFLLQKGHEKREESVKDSALEAPYCRWNPPTESQHLSMYTLNHFCTIYFLIPSTYLLHVAWLLRPSVFIQRKTCLRFTWWQCHKVLTKMAEISPKHCLIYHCFVGLKVLKHFNLTRGHLITKGKTSASTLLLVSN